MNNEEVIRLNKEYNLFSWSVQGAVSPKPMERGEGIYFYDAEDNRYIDLSAQLVNCNIGHQHPKAIAALKEQADILTFSAPCFSNSKKGECAKKIIDLLPDAFGKVFFANAGADANENAIKIARFYTHRSKVLSRYRSYHGATAGAMALTGDPRRIAAEPLVPGAVKFLDPYCYRCPFGQKRESCQLECAKHFEEVVQYEGPNAIAAVFLETITGTNGIIVPPEGYLPRIREICDQYGILMVCDEVMAGFCRTGKMFAFEHFGIVPDMVTMAKGITSGYVPLGAVAMKHEIADYFEDQKLSAGLTYSGHTLAVATACKVMDIYREENLLENSATVGAYAKEQLLKLQEVHPAIGDVRGKGLFIGLEFVKNRDTKELMDDAAMTAFKNANMKDGIYHMTYSNLMNFGPPLVITKEQIDDVLAVIDKNLVILDKACR